MIESMTGYGKASLSVGKFTIESEIKSINSRFLDITVRLPKSLYSKEIEIRNIIKQNINRGKISLNIFLNRDGASGLPEFDKANLNGVVNLLKEIKENSNIPGEIQLSDIMAFQNLIFSDSTDVGNDEFESTKKVILDSIVELKKMRVDEGKQLVKDMLERLSKVEGLVNEISDLGRDTVVEYFEKLKERAKDLVENLTDYTDRLQIELALLSEKYDVTEETVRLNSHIQQFRQTLSKDEEVGKKLNFVLQEMNREANTINNKSVSVEISNRGMEIKEELEKIREQIQNIE